MSQTSLPIYTLFYSHRVFLLDSLSSLNLGIAGFLAVCG